MPKGIQAFADVEAACTEIHRLRDAGYAYDAVEAERNLYRDLLDDASGGTGTRLLTTLRLMARARAMLR